MSHNRITELSLNHTEGSGGRVEAGKKLLILQPFTEKNKNKTDLTF